MILITLCIIFIHNVLWSFVNNFFADLRLLLLLLLLLFYYYCTRYLCMNDEWMPKSSERVGVI